MQAGRVYSPFFPQLFLKEKYAFYFLVLENILQ